MQKNKNVKQIIFGIIIILIGIVVGIIPIFSNIYINKKENIKVENYIEETKNDNIIEDDNLEETINKSEDNLLFVLEIPKINLKRGIYNKYSIENTIEKNVMIMPESSLPTDINGNVVLEAHSGNNYISFFDRLNELLVGDEVDIYFQGIKYTYIVDNMYDVDKDGDVEIFRNNNRNTLTLITCKNNNQYKQYVVILYLLKEEEY